MLKICTQRHECEKIKASKLNLCEPELVNLFLIIFKVHTFPWRSAENLHIFFKWLKSLIRSSNDSKESIFLFKDTKTKCQTKISRSDFFLKFEINIAK